MGQGGAPCLPLATHAYVNPLVAAALGCMAGGEEMTWVRLAGLFIILASIALVRRTHREGGLPPRAPVMEYKDGLSCRESDP